MSVFRWACNKKLRFAIMDFANGSRAVDPWAANIYRRAIERGCRHNHAVRILARAWIRVIWRCWQDGVPFDPARHGARQRIVLDTGPSLASRLGLNVPNGRGSRPCCPGGSEGSSGCLSTVGYPALEDAPASRYPRDYRMPPWRVRCVSSRRHDRGHFHRGRRGHAVPSRRRYARTVDLGGSDICG